MRGPGSGQGGPWHRREIQGRGQEVEAHAESQVVRGPEQEGLKGDAGIRA